MVNIMCPEGEFWVHRNDVVNIDRLIDKKDIVILFEQSDQVFRSRNILSALYSGKIMQNIEFFENRIFMHVQRFITWQQLPDQCVSLFHPFRRNRCVVHAFDYRKNDFNACIKNRFLYKESDRLYIAHDNTSVFSDAIVALPHDWSLYAEWIRD